MNQPEDKKLDLTKVPKVFGQNTAAIMIYLYKEANNIKNIDRTVLNLCVALDVETAQTKSRFTENPDVIDYSIGAFRNNIDKFKDGATKKNFDDSLKNLSEEAHKFSIKRKALEEELKKAPAQQKEKVKALVEALLNGNKPINDIIAEVNKLRDEQAQLDQTVADLITKDYKNLQNDFLDLHKRITDAALKELKPEQVKAFITPTLG